MSSERSTVSPLRHVCAGILCILLAVGCATTGSYRAAGDGVPCAEFDSLYRSSGFEVAIALVGKATIDADQQRLRGKVNLDVKPNGDLLLDFSSTILFGAQREDFFFSIVGDTLRIIDRERGQYYEAEDAERFLAESLGMNFGATQALGLALGRPPACDDIDDLQMDGARGGDVRFTGRVAGAGFEVVFAAEHRRLSELTWPVHLPDDQPDRLRVTYDWVAVPDGGHGLREVVMRLENREWRCKINSTTI